MRYFTLENTESVVDPETGLAVPAELDITTKQILFHEIAGLGFSEEASFRRIGDVWWLDSVNYAQGEITGKMLFTELGGTTPYQKYITFRNFIEKTPLILKYYPHGIDGESVPYRRRVRVTSLEKTEYTEYGVLDCSITFSAYTPWYEVVNMSNASTIVDTTEPGWIWDTPVAFEPLEEVVEGEISRYIIDEHGARVPALRTRFSGEPSMRVSFPEIVGSSRNPIKLTIKGPAENPFWNLYNNGTLVETGGFATNLTLTDSQYLVVDNTDGQYTMKVYSTEEDTVIDVYQIRDFDSACFLSLKDGDNAVVVGDDGGNVIAFSVEGHVYYATV